MHFNNKLYMVNNLTPCTAMFKFMGAKALPVGVQAFGNIGGALFSGIWGATHAQDTSAFQEYKLQLSFKKNQDYLACVMEAQVSDALYQVNQRMDDTHVDNFNSAIAAVLTELDFNCAAHNCLNATDVRPSLRNQQFNASCVVPFKAINNGCWGDSAPYEKFTDPLTGHSFMIEKGWRANDITQCKGYDIDGNIYDGVCGGDGLCWHSDVGFKGTTAYYKQLKVCMRGYWVLTRHPLAF